MIFKFDTVLCSMRSWQLLGWLGVGEVACYICGSWDTMPIYWSSDHNIFGLSRRDEIVSILPNKCG